MSHKIIFLNCFDLKCHYVTVFWKSLCVLFYNCTEFKISVIKFWPSLWSSSLLLKRKFSNRPFYQNSEQNCSKQEMTGENGLEVIGAGFSKTGTKTMHQVYKILGYGVNDSHENVFM